MSLEPPLRSCLYLGQVMHRRLRPFSHRFAYRVFSLLLDLDDLPRLDGAFRLLRVNGTGILSFHERDHGPRDGSPLKPWITHRLAEAGIDLDGGAIRLLCFPRMFGYVFNPLSVWFCHRRDGTLAAVLYEVANTFGQMHHYLIPTATAVSEQTPIDQHCAKTFYVSPFLPVEGGYSFRLRPPGERLSLAMRHATAEGTLLVAVHEARRAALDDRALLRALLAYPLMTFKVIAAIHWQALRLWRRGAPRYRRQPMLDAGTARTGAPARAEAP